MKPNVWHLILLEESIKVKHRCIKELLDDAAQAIRELDGTTEKIIGDDIPDRIRALRGRINDEDLSEKIEP